MCDAMIAILAKVPMWLYILIFAVCVIGVQQWRLNLSNHRAVALQSVANTLHEANQTNVATIATLEAANRKWADDNAANLANAKVYTDAAMEYAKQQQAAAASANAKLRAIYAKQPDAKAWASVALPADVVSVLRETDSPHTDH